MTEWGVVGVIIALVGFGVTVLKPILTLNTSIVKLTERMEHVSHELNQLTDQNTENHKRIWQRIDEHGEMLNDHEQRLDHFENLERKKYGP